MTPLQKALERLYELSEVVVLNRIEFGGRHSVEMVRLDKIKTLLPEILKEVEEAKENEIVEKLREFPFAVKYRDNNSDIVDFDYVQEQINAFVTSLKGPNNTQP